MNVRIVIVRVRYDVPRTAAVTGVTQPLRPHIVLSAIAPFTPPRIAVLIGLAFLAGIVLPLHPALCIGTLGVLVAVLLKISAGEVVP